MTRGHMTLEQFFGMIETSVNKKLIYAKINLQYSVCIKLTKFIINGLIV